MHGLVDFAALWWAPVTTVILPFVVALIAKCSWSANLKGWLAFGLSAAVGLLAALSSGIALTPENVGAVIIAVFGGAQLAYRLFNSFGITSAWLDWLLALGSPTE